MSDDTMNTGSETYEAEFFARKHGITVDQARRLIDELGHDRTLLDQAAQEMKHPVHT